MAPNNGYVGPSTGWEEGLGKRVHTIMQALGMPGPVLPDDSVLVAHACLEVKIKSGTPTRTLRVHLTSGYLG